MRITSKGQVTIPVRIREQAGFLPNTEVDFTMDGDSVRLVRHVRSKKGRSRGEALVQGMHGRATVRLTTEEIMSHTRGR